MCRREGVLVVKSLSTANNKLSIAVTGVSLRVNGAVRAGERVVNVGLSFSQRSLQLPR